MNDYKRFDGRVLSCSNRSMGWAQFIRQCNIPYFLESEVMSDMGIHFPSFPSILSSIPFILTNLEWKRRKKSWLERTHNFSCKNGQNYHAKIPQSVYVMRNSSSSVQGTHRGEFKVIQEEMNLKMCMLLITTKSRKNLR